MPSNWQTRPMSKAERRIWRKIKRNVAELTPAMQRAIEQAFALIRTQLSERRFEMAMRAQGSAAAGVLLAGPLLEAPFDRARQMLAESVRDATQTFIHDLPGGRQGVIGFNVLDRRVVMGIRNLDSRVMGSLRDEVRETFRDAVRAGIEEGASAQTIARRVRSSIGLAPRQLEAVDNFRAALESGRVSKALGYELRDRRFDSTVRKMDDTPLTAEKIDRMVDAYRRRSIRHNAEMHARTALNDSQRLGRHLATEAGIDAGVLPAERMRSRWSSSEDGKVRPSHQEANGEVVRFGEPFSTGDVIPGASEWGCRCIKVDFIARS